MSSRALFRPSRPSRLIIPMPPLLARIMPDLLAVPAGERSSSGCVLNLRSAQRPFRAYLGPRPRYRRMPAWGWFHHGATRQRGLTAHSAAAGQEHYDVRLPALRFLPVWLILG